MQHDHLVVMAGGTGQRFWPWSSKIAPKQFQDLLGKGNSLLQGTLERFQAVILPTNMWVVTQAPYRDMVKEQLPWLQDHQILDEPVAKNTAPCIAYACHKIAQYDPAANLVITPADHIVANNSLFSKTIQQALASAQQTSKLMLVGVPCIRPETGYGYIAYKQQKGAVKPVIKFVEKPPSKQALSYIQQGNYVWNTGIFVGKLSTFKQNYQTYLPSTWSALEAIQASLSADQEKNALNKIYQQLSAISFDHAILEKAKDLAVIDNDFGWSDLGTWSALYEHLPKDASNNVIQGNVVALDTDQCLIKASNNGLIATYGLKDLVIVQHHDVLLICPRAAVQNLKALIKHIDTELGGKYL